MKNIKYIILAAVTAGALSACTPPAAPVGGATDSAYTSEATGIPAVPTTTDTTADPATTDTTADDTTEGDDPFETSVVETFPETTVTSADPAQTIEITSPAYEALPEAKISDIYNAGGSWFSAESGSAVRELKFDSAGGFTVFGSGGDKILSVTFVPYVTRFSVEKDGADIGYAQLVGGDLQVTFSGTGVCDGIYVFEVS